MIALTDNVATITAWANDTNFMKISFAEQLKSLVEPNDIAFAISGEVEFQETS